jgi:hypothetical protein
LTQQPPFVKRPSKIAEGQQFFVNQNGGSPRIGAALSPSAPDLDGKFAPSWLWRLMQNETRSIVGASLTGRGDSTNAR